MLYNNVKATTIEIFQPIAQQIASTHDDEFLKTLNRIWSDVKLCIIMIKDILLYMNKNFVPKLKLQTVEHMQTSQFKH
ncbi:MAG: cullin [bacterium]|jgi:cullin 3